MYVMIIKIIRFEASDADERRSNVLIFKVKSRGVFDDTARVFL